MELQHQNYPTLERGQSKPLNPYDELQKVPKNVEYVDVVGEQKVPENDYLDIISENPAKTSEYDYIDIVEENPAQSTEPEYLELIGKSKTARWVKIVLTVIIIVLVMSLVANVIMLVFFVLPESSCACKFIRLFIHSSPNFGSRY